MNAGGWKDKGVKNEVHSRTRINEETGIVVLWATGLIPGKAAQEVIDFVVDIKNKRK